MSAINTFWLISLLFSEKEGHLLEQEGGFVGKKTVYIIPGKKGVLSFTELREDVLLSVTHIKFLENAGVWSFRERAWKWCFALSSSYS